ncbi:LTXXQ motif family protein [Malonomonas rubra DSM 5091]|uniref:LTXXQ motif family protein n=1 Tax=Malonomonas rubra DSM 5091 TaxID=1122189 RepID=A0A1M6L4I7_MALRU|nr:Spy/CpxP family protein refolding chaperone [Malonomonas rubra]SHJ66145.1 LTXXQ motif family protein [Malonomonas rubra DSM 5091]
MKKRIIISTVLIGALMTGGIAMAKSYGSWPGNGNGNGYSNNQEMMTKGKHQQQMQNRLERMSVILDLSDNQEEQIEALFNKHWQDRQAVRDEMRVGREGRRPAMRSGDLDETTLRSNLAERAEFKADRIVEREQLKKEVYAILSPEQQEKAETIWETRGKGQNGRYAKRFGI